MALLLFALGHSDVEIAQALGCNRSTVVTYLGPRRTRAPIAPEEVRALFEQYDAWRNMEEVLIAASGSAQQARLRTSLRARTLRGQTTPSDAPSDALGGDDDPFNEDISDEQLRRELGALVERTRDPGSGA